MRRPGTPWKHGVFLRNMREFILASASPRRKTLLEELGASFTVAPADIDERAIAAPTPDETVKKLALAKAGRVFGAVNGHMCGRADEPRAVLGADSVVVLDGEILGKPKDGADAVRMLRALSGRRHEVKTGIAFLTGGKTYSECVTTEVFLDELGESFIAAYVATGSPLDKAGAYGIQDGVPVREIKGSYSNVVGLPAERVAEILRAERFL